MLRSWDIADTMVKGTHRWDSVKMAPLIHCSGHFADLHPNQTAPSVPFASFPLYYSLAHVV
jgi:hypothetical protein